MAVDESDALVDDDRNSLLSQLLIFQRVAAVERHGLDVFPQDGALFLVAHLNKFKFFVTYEIFNFSFNILLTLKILKRVYNTNR